MAIRFHLDEHVPSAVAAGLRRHGIDVTTTADAALLGHEDPDHLAFASQQRRVLVTHDADFTRMHADGVEHAGICYCHILKYTSGELLRCLLLVDSCFQEEEFTNHLEYL